MKTLRQLFPALVIVMLASLPAAADEKGAQGAAPAPVVVYKASAQAAVAAGDYTLLQIVQDFPPKSGVPDHQHGGHVVATVLSGQITLREKGAERVVKTGESWTEAPGAIHSVVNAGSETVRVAVSILLPKGAEATTLVK